ncbi:hypothetical protein [Amaricoccus macauensis]|uniref:hypothetical protein n=1 Tax=Amaricoccus macauensis TaxID=57001 RepID=UPI003C7AB3F1
MILQDVVEISGAAMRSRQTRVCAAILGLLTAVILALAFSIPWLAMGTAHEMQIRELLFLGQENSLGEKYCQALSFAIALCFVISATLRRSAVLFALALLFGFIWFDDTMLYHERVGKLLASGLDLPAVSGLRPQDLGELLAWLVAAMMLFPVFLRAWFKRQTGEAALLVILGLCMAALAFFGIVVDMIHVLASGSGTLDFLFANIEDGGEILVMAVVAVLAIRVLAMGETQLVRTRRTEPEAARAWAELDAGVPVTA